MSNLTDEELLNQAELRFKALGDQRTITQQQVTVLASMAASLLVLARNSLPMNVEAPTKPKESL